MKKKQWEKLVAESKTLEEKLIILSYKHNNEITLAIDDIVKLFDQQNEKARN